MAGSQIDRTLYAAFSPTMKQQADLKTPLSASELTKRHPFAQAGSAPTRTRNRKIVYHCNGIDIVEEKITDQFSRWTFSFPADATLIGGWAAMNYGSATVPIVVTPANEIQTVQNAAADTDTWQIVVPTIEGRAGGTTKPLAVAANAAAIRTALEEINNLEPGDVSVTGTLTAGVAITFIGRMAKADIPALSTIKGGGMAGTITVTETTKGVQRVHPIARSVSDDLPKTSFIIGFEEDETPPLLHKGYVCDAIIVEAESREDLVCTVELIGSAETEEVLDFVVPACQTVNPINTMDCRFIYDGAFVTEDLERVRFERRNNVPVGKGAFPWDSKDIALLWRGRNPTEEFSFGYYGSRGDSLYNRADRELNTEKANATLHIGNMGDRVSIIAPKTLLKLAEPDLTFDNDLRRSVVNIVGTPHFDDSINASSRVEARIAQSTAFLTL